MDAKEAAPFHRAHVIVEEKIDGSNLGISKTDDNHLIFQNRYPLALDLSSISLFALGA